jgi:FeS assembly SUF system protein
MTEQSKQGKHPVNRMVIEGDVVEALRTIYDPEIPVNIYDMGLIYGVHVDEEGFVRVEMTLTAPGCPVAVSLPLEVQETVRAVRGVKDAIVDIVWDPPWTPERMSEEARLELGFL